MAYQWNQGLKSCTTFEKAYIVISDINSNDY